MLRKAKLDDANSIAMLMVDNKKAFGEPFCHLSYHEQQEKLEEELNQAQHSYYVYIDDETDQIVGSLKFQKQEDEIEIIEIDVHGNHQKKGIGTFLLEFVKEEGYHINGNKIFLWCLANNEPVICFLEYQGFHQNGKRKMQMNGKSYTQIKYEYEL